MLLLWGGPHCQMWSCCIRVAICCNVEGAAIHGYLLPYLLRLQAGYRNGILRGVFIEILIRTPILGFAVFGCYLDEAHHLSIITCRMFLSASRHIQTYPQREVRTNMLQILRPGNLRRARELLVPFMNDWMMKEDMKLSDRMWYNDTKSKGFKRPMLNLRWICYWTPPLGDCKGPQNTQCRWPRCWGSSVLVGKWLGKQQIIIVEHVHPVSCNHDDPGRSNGPSRAANEHLLQ